VTTTHLDTSSVEDYRRFLAIKALPRYSIQGHMATFPDEYADRIGMATEETADTAPYTPPAWMFDYQRAVTTTAIEKRKYCLFIDCGYGKTAIFLEFARHVREQLPTSKRILIVSPLMVIPQTMAEAATFFPGMKIERVVAKDLPGWMHGTGGIGITNYDAITDDITQGNLGCLILDESSMMKSAYGKWATKLLEISKGIGWKLAATGTPAPNDRIEYANHAVFMDAFPNVNSFLARFFINRGQTSERWALKPHALNPFYRALSHWCIFMTNPATYGWTDNAETIPPIHIHEHNVPMTDEQQQLAFAGSGNLFAHNIGGITSRSVLSQIAKGSYKGTRIATYKPAYIADLVASWPNESTIIWCRFNAEQKILEEALPDAVSISGSTPDEERQTSIRRFKDGMVRTIITKPKILGFGLNLQIATRQIFSACDDSYEEFYQAVKRSNRVGSTQPLNVHLPVTDIERIQMENVLRKSRMVQHDTEVQERLFKGESER
jgi:superfamily II DNA or RNA helicase